MGLRGPAPKGEYAGKSQVFSTRIRPDLRQRLEESARLHGRSLSQEVEHRLRRSLFDEDDDKEKLFGGEKNYNIARMIGLTMQMTRVPFQKPVAHWTDDPLQFEAVRKAVDALLTHLRPSSPSAEKPIEQEAMAEFVSEQIPAALWKMIQDANPSLSLLEGTLDDHRAGVLKADLGELVARPKPQILGADELRKIDDRIRQRRSRQERKR